MQDVETSPFPGAGEVRAPVGYGSIVAALKQQGRYVTCEICTSETLAARPVDGALSSSRTRRVDRTAGLIGPSVPAIFINQLRQHRNPVKGCIGRHLVTGGENQSRTAVPYAKPAFHRLHKLFVRAMASEDGGRDPAGKDQVGSCLLAGLLRC